MSESEGNPDPSTSSQSSGSVPPSSSDALWAYTRRSVVFAYHLLMWVFAFELAMQLRFDGEISQPWLTRQWPVLGILVALRVIGFYRFGLFHGLWRYAGMPELRNIAWASTVPTVLCFALGMMVEDLRLPRTIYVGEWLASIVLVGGSRFAIRMVRERHSSAPRVDAVHALIVGAGDDGESLLRDIQRTPNSPWVIKGFLDDARAKSGALVRDIRVLGPADEGTLVRLF